MGFPLLLASHVLFDHDMLDMATHYSSHYEVTTELRIDAAGSATFRIAGNVTSQGVELTPTAGARTVMASHVTRVDDTWTGHATASPGTVVVRFDHGANYPGGVDVEWRCDASTTIVSSLATAVWKCATSQSMTRPTGAAHSLPAYMQVPTYFAAAAVALRVNATARGGADHRSSITMLQLSR